LRRTIIPFVFGNPGTTETTFLAAVAASKASYVLSLHESCAVGIAAGYALITGKPSVVSLHTYPGRKRIGAGLVELGAGL
jgi:benzoylformate decarboxylase